MSAEHQKCTYPGEMILFTGKMQLKEEGILEESRELATIDGKG